VREDAESYPQDCPRNREKQALKRVEANKPISVVRLHDQENDRWNDREISEHACDIIRHTLTWSSGRGRRSGA
jgi:hypothetical protein